MADLTPHAADGGLLTNIASHLGLGVGGAVVIWRALIAFGRQDRAAKMEAELRDELRKQNARLTADIADIAHERNEAVQVKLQLVTELRVEKERRVETAQQRDEARAAVARAEAEIERLTAENHRLIKEARISEVRGEVGGGRHVDERR